MLSPSWSSSSTQVGNFHWTVQRAVEVYYLLTSEQVYNISTCWAAMVVSYFISDLKCGLCGMGAGGRVVWCRIVPVIQHCYNSHQVRGTTPLPACIGHTLTSEIRMSVKIVLFQINRKCLKTITFCRCRRGSWCFYRSQSWWALLPVNSNVRNVKYFLKTGSDGRGHKIHSSAQQQHRVIIDSDWCHVGTNIESSPTQDNTSKSNQDGQNVHNGKWWSVKTQLDD